MPPQVCRFVLNLLAAIRQEIFFFIADDPVFFPVFPADTHAAEIAFPVSAQITEEHGPDIFHERRLAAFVAAVHDDQAVFRRIPAHTMVNPEIIQMHLCNLHTA